MLAPQQHLLNYVRDNTKLQQIREQLKQPSERTYNGTIPSYEWTENVLGNNIYEKIILATPGIEQLGTSKETAFTVLGGSCVLRTKCFHRLKAGFITDMVTGEKKNITSVAQVAEWIENAISLDQIVDIVGPYKGAAYAIISEEYLWLQKIMSALEHLFNRKLTDNEQDMLAAAIQKSEQKKHEMLKKYLAYVTQKEAHVVRIVDADIFDELREARDTLLDALDIKFEQLKELYKNIFHTNQKTDDSLYAYLDSVSIIETMYSGLYLNILQKRGYVKTPKGIIIEPWIHARLGNILNIKKVEKKHMYLYSGIDTNLAFIAMDSASTKGFLRTQSKKSIQIVPNIYNYKKIFNNTAFISKKLIEYYLNYFSYILFDQDKEEIKILQQSSHKIDYDIIKKNILHSLNTLSYTVFE